MRVTVKGDQLVFDDYPFACASVGKSLMLLAKDIDSILPQRSPPEIWLRSGEIIFVSAESIEDLIAFADQHHIRLESRMDVWALLNEEALDTEHSDESKKQTLAILADNGISEVEVMQIRIRVGRRLLLANSFWWEWIHLGQYDMLRANRGIPVLGAARFQKLYWDSMAIARKAQPWTYRADQTID